MTRPAWPRLLACLLAAVVSAGGCVALTAGTAAADDTSSVRTPLQVSVETLAPSTIPQRGRVTLTGRITNRSADTWTDLNVYLLTSDTPIRTRGELADAAATDADTQVGNRRTTDGLYDKVGDLAPGQSVPYRLSLSRKDLGLSGEPGVYWVGVHVLGALDGERDSVADGRARTFMPLLPAPGTPAAQRSRTRVALLVPLQAPVARGAAGRVLDLPRWNSTLAADGRLDRLLRLGGTSRRPFTWLLDPSLLDAVQSVARGNPALDPGPDRSGSGSPTNSPSATASGGPSSSSDPSGSPSDAASGGSGSSADPTSGAKAARAWLAEFRAQAPTHTIAALPYGNLDVASVLGGPLPSVYRQAVTLSSQALAGYGVKHPVRVVAPPSGFLPGEALSRVGTGTPVVLGQPALPGSDGPVTLRKGRPPVVLTDAAAGNGGPQPNSQYAALAVRQRLLSDAALHALSAQRDEPLVVRTPTNWNPGDAVAGSRFFAGLDKPWLQLVDLPSVVATAPTGSGADAEVSTYPEADRLAQVPLANVEATRGVVRVGRIFATLLTANDTVDDVLSRTAMLASSDDVRTDPDLARARATETVDYVRSQMAQVRVEGPPFVMMSGESGPIQVTLVNDLEQPVRVGLQVATPGSDLRIEHVDPVTLGPGRRTSIRLKVASDDIGVHAVTLTATDSSGARLGSQTQFSVRTSRVSTVIWVIMAIGGALLLVAIMVRLFRRVRLRRATHGPLLQQGTPPQGSGGPHADPGLSA